MQTPSNATNLVYPSPVHSINSVFDEPSNAPSEDEGEEDDLELSFYRRAKLHRPHVWPFSNASRANPCSSHAEPRVRKDAIQRHLQKVKSAGGDSEHPLDDPLWEDFEVRFYILPRPSKYDEKKRKKGSRLSAQRYYKKRKDVQEQFTGSMKERYDADEITEAEYAKYLIGDKRRTFITEAKVRAELKKEYRLKDDIEKKLQHLRNLQTSNTTGETSITDLESFWKDIESTKATIDTYKEIILSQAAYFVNLWTDNGFLETKTTYFQHYGEFTWPTSASETSFYLFAALLTPKSKWNGQIRSDANISQMQQELQEYVNSGKHSPELDHVVKIFNNCCDEIKRNEKRAVSWSVEGEKRWLSEQARLWEMAKMACEKRFNFNDMSVIRHVRMINDFAGAWWDHKTAGGIDQSKEGELRVDE